MTRPLLNVLRNPLKAFLVGVIRLYQLVVSPALPGRCKYYPSCSQYALDAVREYGVLRGFVLGTWRVLRCNPLSNGGYDPVSRQRLFRSRAGVTIDATAGAAPEPQVGGGGPISPARASQAHGSCGHAHHAHPVRG
jgi:uncharacterized protein